MTAYSLAILLAASLVGSLLAAVVAFFGKGMHRASNIILGLSALAGTIVAIVVATADPSLHADWATIVLPNSFFDPAVDPSTIPVQPLFYGMLFGLDRFSAIFYALLSLVTVLVSIYTIPYLEKYQTTYNVRNVNVLTALFVFGMQGVILSSNVIGFMTFWEIMSVASFFLVMADRSEASRQAGFLYLIISHLGASAILASLFLFSGGNLLDNFSVMSLAAGQLPAVEFTVALMLFFLGFGSKMGLVPLHVWLPDAHSEAPSHVSALLSGVMLNMGLYGFLRVLLFVLPSVPLWFIFAVMVSGALSAIGGVLFAVIERDIKRVLAYSSIEYMGLIFLMLGLALLSGREGSVELTQTLLYTIVFLAFAHALFKSGLFMSAGTLISAVHSRSLEVMGGLARRLPQFSVVVFLLILSAAALPPFAPFVSEWALMQSVIGALEVATPVLKVTLVVALGVISFVAGLSVFAMVKLYGLAFLGKARSDLPEDLSEPVLGLMAPIAITAALSLLMGIFAPAVFNSLGAIDLINLTTGFDEVTVAGQGMSPLGWTVIIVGLVVLVLIVRNLVSKPKFERAYHTWDCGQPITPRMEYTATGFSAPLRFFFRFWLRSQKVISVTPLAPNNPWMASRTMTLNIRQAIYDRAYVPIGVGVERLAGLVVRLQNGSIQFYVGMILIALLITLIIAV